MKKSGFTLAEVLITLTIIGIVAAVTIPSVIANYQQQEFKTGLRKAVSVLNEAIQANIVLEGETPYEANDIINYLQKHMSVVQSYKPMYPWDGNAYFYTTDGMKFEFGHERTNESFRTTMKPGKLILHETGIPVSTSTTHYFNKWKQNGGGCGGRYSVEDIDNWDDFCGYSGSYRSGNCGSYGLANNRNKTTETPCAITVDVNGDRGPSPYKEYQYWGNGDIDRVYVKYKYPSPNDRRVTDVFNILITEDRAIPFGVVAQRAMYEK